jgi:hypothetical protein
MLLRKSRNSNERLPTQRMVVIYNLNNEIIDVYINTIIAAENLNCSFSLISKRCRRHTVTNMQQWSYLKDLPESQKEEAIKCFLKKYNND